MEGVLGNTTDSLAELPQLLRHGIVLGLGVDFPHGAVGEVTPTEVFDALLHSAVQGGLSSLDGVLEEEGGHR